MKRVLLLFVAMMVSVVGFAQLEVKPDSFKEIPGFVNQNPEIYDDDNNVLYAVIKVRTENLNDKQRHQLLFQGNAVTFIELEYHQDEIWVYLSSIPATYLKISHPDFGSTEFNLPFDLEPQKGYEMVLINKTANESAWGSLTVITKPESEATITINGKVISPTTPYTNDMIPPGQYEITVSKERYKPVTKTVIIKNGDIQTVEFDMPAICSVINLTSEPSGAKVYIDNKEYGVTPCAIKDIIIGQHALKVVKDGFLTVKKQFILKENVTLKANIVMAKCPEGALSGVFSVGPTKKIIFSKGSLQYQPSTKTWRFAEKQTDTIGDENRHISPYYEGWIDLFGWGTGDCPTKILPDDQTPSFVDWGNNPISNGGNVPNQWRTLGKDEWDYLLIERETKSGIRFAGAIVDGVKGEIVFPDDWDAATYEIIKANEGYKFYKNIISRTEWTDKFEANGAVFLPALGQRNKKNVSDGIVFYWTSTVECFKPVKTEAYRFSNDQKPNCFYGYYLKGYGVRLVRSADDIIAGVAYTDDVLE